ncbi:MAG: SPOR domain-containing protein [Blastocatellia bacterium]
MRSKTNAFLVLMFVLFFAAFAEAQGTRFAVQLEAKSSEADAEARVTQLKAQSVQAYVVKSAIAGKGTFYRVRVGNFTTQATAKKFGEDLVRRGVVPEFFVAPYEQPLGGNTAAAAPVKPVAKPTPAPAPANTAVKEPAKNPAPTTNPPKPEPAKPAQVAVNTNLPGNTPAPAGSGAAFARFQDPSVGYSFEYPSYWAGQPLDPKDAADQRVNAGALFKSAEDSAFLNAIWNKLDKANSPDNDNDLIVEIILKSMSSGDGTQLKETSRKVVNENGLVKTYLDLKAVFQSQGQTTPLDFVGKAVIVRASKGILLVVAFYSKDAPSNSASIADRIIASVRAPE